MFKLSKRSIERMTGVDDNLVKIVKRAIEITPIDFGVTEGLRTKERQKKLVADGKSRTMRSRHLVGEAVDVVAYIGSDISWDKKYYHQIADAMKQAAEELDLNITWGGDWQTFFDGCHFQIED
tara:strand:- start:18062 stop:18430 length:369 start_codon:yes stop_codon:yes gene_type:complete